jgi:hypothetical protein
MSEVLQIWLFAGGFGLISVLFLLWWSHIQNCRAIASDIAVIKEVLTTIRVEIGSRDTGIRGEIHAHSSLLAQHSFRLNLLDRMEDVRKP